MIGFSSKVQTINLGAVHYKPTCHFQKYHGLTIPTTPVLANQGSPPTQKGHKHNSKNGYRR